MLDTQAGLDLPPASGLRDSGQDGCSPSPLHPEDRLSGGGEHLLGFQGRIRPWAQGATYQQGGKARAKACEVYKNLGLSGGAMGAPAGEAHAQHFKKKTVQRIAVKSEWADFLKGCYCLVCDLGGGVGAQSWFSGGKRVL